MSYIEDSPVPMEKVVEPVHALFLPCTPCHLIIHLAFRRMGSLCLLALYEYYQAALR